MKNLNILFIILSAIFLLSCEGSGSNKNFQPNVTGKAGELMLIVDKHKWESAVGDSLRAIFKQEVQVLPQKEPIFTVINIPNSAFSTLFQTHRNIVRVKISPKHKKPSIVMKRHVWARPQLYFEIKVPSDSSFFELFEKNKQSIVDTLLKDERARYLQSYRKFENPEITRVLKKRAVKMRFPKGYDMDVQKDAFMWISHETPMISQGVIISFINYSDTAQLHKENLIHQIDSVLRENVHTELDGSYMTIEKRIDIPLKKLILNNNYTVKLKGLWRTEGDYMGGPFVALVSVDTKRNRLVITFGYVYAPRYNKRNYMRQVETILYSLKIRE
ncbi:MAG: DUF4837 family protein [Bacteroidota bacterium]